MNIQTEINSKTIRLLILILAVLSVALSSAFATVSVSPLYGNNMVVQRDKPFPVWGTAAPNKTITVTYNNQTSTTTSDALGNWQLTLPAMSAKASGSNFTISEAGGNTITLSNVVVGDVWLCSGQSNMAFGLGSCNRQSDINSANYPGIRHFWVPLANLGDPSKNLSGSWSVCSSSTAGGFSAVAFYFGRKIYLDQSNNIPVGLIASTVGGTCIDPWLAPEGCTDLPVLAPLFSQSILPWGPFALFNGMIYPLAPFPMKGAIWYQGENRETTSQSSDSYFLKEKALQQGWRRLLAQDDFAFYAVLLANYGTANTSATPDLVPGTTWADTRIQQVNVLGLPHAGVASALDVGNPADIHPTDKLDVGERLALWALKNDYARTSLVPSGPTLRDVTVSGSTLVCSFDYVGAGLMVGSKTPYLPTAEVVGGALTNFSIAGASGSWYAATATINQDNTITVASPSVSAPRKVAYACWQSPTNCNFYNRDGLPANPFYVDDVTAKYTVTASAEAGGSISPAGTATYLKRMTALYTITPDAGSFIQDVKVDGVSVGAVTSYTFDPLYANHSIAVTFTDAKPRYPVNASVGAGGLLSPTGAVMVAQGGTQSFSITPNPGNLVTVLADGKAMGQRASYTFGDVRTAHTLAVAFTCTINAQAGYGGTISPNGTTVVTYGANQTFTISPLANFSIAKVTVDGTNLGVLSSYTFTNVVGPHTITATFAGSGGSGSVPQQSQIVFSCLTDTLPASGTISSWSTYLPSGQSLTSMGSPTVETVDGRKFDKNMAVDGDGFRFGSSYSSSIPCTGASIVVVAKPTRYGTDNGWQSLVDVFYDRLVLGIMNGSGRICVRRNGSVDYSSGIIPEGQTTILSLVVQPDGTYKVHANGTQAMTITGASDMSALVPGVTGGAGGFGSYINVGRNNPDGWTTFNGDIGDVFLYKTALSDTDRVSLETYLANRLAGTSATNYTITASAGANGSINPSGSVAVASGGSQTFTITPNAGCSIAQVTVDGTSLGALSSYTFTNVTTNHTILASFSGPITNTITASAGANGSISPSGAVPVLYGASQTFTITPNLGYAIADVTVDGVAQGPLRSYTFTNVTVSHSISATFLVGLTYTITATADGNGAINPSGTVLVNAGASQTFTLVANPGYSISNVVVDSTSVGPVSSYTFTNVSTNHTISATFSVASNPGLMFSVTNTALGAAGSAISSWCGLTKRGGNPTVTITNGIKWEANGPVSSGSGFQVGGEYTSPLALNGLSVVAAVRANNTAAPGSGGWNPKSLVNFFYNGLVFGAESDGSLLLNIKNSGLSWSRLGATPFFLPSNAPTVLSLVVAVDGSYNVWANGTKVMTGGAIAGGFTSLDPHANTSLGDPSWCHYITLGRNYPDGWSSFDGWLGDVYVYTNVLSDSARQQLEASLTAKFNGLPPTTLPTLAIALNSSGQIEITWPDSYNGPLLWTPTLGPAVSWTAVGIVPDHVGSLFRVTVAPDAGARFYALGQ